MTLVATLLDRAIDSGVLRETADDLAVTETVRDAVERTRSEIEDDEVEAQVASIVADASPEFADPLERLADPKTFLAIWRVLDDRLDDLTVDEMVVGAALVAMVDADAPDHGVPGGFLPVDLDLLAIFLQVSERSIVYVWRDDCPPCDSLAEKFEDLLADGSEPISLFAVYGPDWARRLREDYDVAVGPTTLFVLGPRVDSRLVGDKFVESIEKEIRALVEA